MSKLSLVIFILIFIAQPNLLYAESVDDNSLSYSVIQKRLAPVGSVYLAGQKSNATIVTANGASRSGKTIYDNVCMVCHSVGAVGSPKFGSKTAWLPRAKKGLDQLLQHALQGYNFMPPRGTCEDCSDQEIKAAITYMLHSSQ